MTLLVYRYQGWPKAISPAPRGAGIFGVAGLSSMDSLMHALVELTKRAPVVEYIMRFPGNSNQDERWRKLSEGINWAFEADPIEIFDWIMSKGAPSPEIHANNYTEDAEMGSSVAAIGLFKGTRDDVKPKKPFMVSKYLHHTINNEEYTFVVVEKGISTEDFSLVFSLVHSDYFRGAVFEKGKVQTMLSLVEMDDRELVKFSASACKTSSRVKRFLDITGYNRHNEHVGFFGMFTLWHFVNEAAHAPSLAIGKKGIFPRDITKHLINVPLFNRLEDLRNSLEICPRPFCVYRLSKTVEFDPKRTYRGIWHEMKPVCIGVSHLTTDEAENENGVNEYYTIIFAKVKGDFNHALPQMGDTFSVAVSSLDCTGK